MKIEIIAAVCEAVYYNGRVKEGSRKLDRRDFVQLCKAANGTIMRKLYYELRRFEAELLYFGDYVDTKTATVKKSGKEFYVELDDNTMNLPHGIGIFAVYPLTKDGDHTERCERIQKGQIGADWLYCGEDFDGIPFYIKKGKRIFIYNYSCLKEGEEVEIDGLFRDDLEMEIPDDIAFDVINAVLGLTLKVAGFPIDKSNDDDPNVIELRKRIAEPATL